jgi:hypothetical protein
MYVFIIVSLSQKSVTILKPLTFAMMVWILCELCDFLFRYQILLAMSEHVQSLTYEN